MTSTIGALRLISLCLNSGSPGLDRSRSNLVLNRIEGSGRRYSGGLSQKKHYIQSDLLGRASCEPRSLASLHRGRSLESTSRVAQNAIERQTTLGFSLRGYTADKPVGQNWLARARAQDSPRALHLEVID